MFDHKFFKCRHCGNLVMSVYNSGVPIVCCGEPMEEIRANTVDASKEKHIPVVSIDNGKAFVTVGAVDHPMIQEHFIQWIVLETNEGVQMKYLEPGQPPKTMFEVGTDVPVAVYAYCNLHGLWKKEM